MTLEPGRPSRMLRGAREEDEARARTTRACRAAHASLGALHGARESRRDRVHHQTWSTTRDQFNHLVRTRKRRRQFPSARRPSENPK